MTSEGSYRTEFSLHVPEEEFHEMFKRCINEILSEDFSEKIKIDSNKGVKRSRAPAKIRKLIPFSNEIPFFIPKNKEFAKEYLKVAFEAEGSLIVNLKGNNKRWIKLSRNTNITHLIDPRILPLQKRLYLKEIASKFPVGFKKISKKAPRLLKREHQMLKMFGIENKIKLEAIRKNKVSNRVGEVSARWTLVIYANNINKFIKEIGFTSTNKKNKEKEALSVKARNPQYSALQIIKTITNKKTFYRKEFIKKM